MKHFVYLLIILVLALLISNILSYFTRQLEGIDNCSEKKKAMVSDNKAKINSMTKTLNEMKVAYENLDKKADKNKTMNQANKQKQNERAEKDKVKVNKRR